MRLVYEDTANHMDETDPTFANFNGVPDKSDAPPSTSTSDSPPQSLPQKYGNHGLYMRHLLTKEGSVELMSRLRLDFFEQIKYVPNGVGIKLRFHRQKPEFCFHVSD